MDLESERRRQVMRDEADRMEARERYARHRNQQGRDKAAKHDERQRYIARHGRDGAFRITVVKWTLAAAVLGILVFCGELDQKGLLGATGAAIGCFAVWAGIGVARALYLANSDR